MSDVVIKIENLSKKYQLGQISTGTLTRDLQRWFFRIRGKDDPTLKIGQENILSRKTEKRSSKIETDFIWALQDINLDVNQGEILGIIGKNGAGKSTLLKILSQVTLPTIGSVKVKGRIASLLEVGTGFHSELTGRENVFLNGAIMGMTKREIDAKFDEIVDFSGVEKYIDTPVKRYSSGMYVRLAFAVAAHLEPEILVVDEVLAVGDAEFQKKALGKMQDVSREYGRTVLFVSHNMAAVKNLCNTAICLLNGEISISGEVDKCINYYRESFVEDSINNSWCRLMPEGKTMYFIMANCKLLTNKVFIGIEIGCKNNCYPGFIAFDFQNSLGNTLFQSIPRYEPFIHFSSSAQYLEVEVDIPLLIPDTYYISLWIGSHFNDTYDWQQNVLKFEVIENPIKKRLIPHSLKNGNIVATSKLIKHEKKIN